MSGPQTEAGRRLLYDWNHDDIANRLPEDGGLVHEQVERIEREAVTAFLASPEAAEGLAAALHTTGYDYEVTSEAQDFAAAILAAWQQERAK